MPNPITLKTVALSAAVTVTGVALSASTSQAQTFEQINTVSLDGVFNGSSDFGDNPVSVAFDGTTAFVGGFNNTGAAGNVGVVAVTDLFGVYGSATTTGLAPTVTEVVAGRAFNSVAYDAVSGDLLVGYDSGSASTGFIARHSGVDGSQVWQTVSPDARRVFAVGVDPQAPDGGQLAAFFSQGSGRRLALDFDDGSLVFSDGQPSPGGAIIVTATNTGYRGADFDSDGNLATAASSGQSYHARSSVNTFDNSVVLDDDGLNNVGRDVAILEDAGFAGEDLLAHVLRDSNAGIDDTNVIITDLSGNVITALTGDESGLATAFTSDNKAVDFALAPDGTPTLVVTDFVERRLDVYSIVIPEPASLGLLSLGGLALLRRRK